MTTLPVRAAMSLALAVAVLSTAAATGAMAAEDETGKNSVATATTIERVKGVKLKLAKAKVTKNWVRFKDPADDQVRRDGSPAPGAEPWTDLTTVSVARFGAVIKMLRVLGEDYPVGTAGTYYGADADWQAGQDAFYIVAKTAAKLPRDIEGGVQLIVTFDGEDAVPLRAGGLLGPYDGAQTFSLSGPFEGGAWASGTTDLGGWQRSEPIPFYNGPSRDMGYYDRKAGTFMHVARVPKGATSATVTLRSEGADGEIFDELRLPSGGRFLGLDSTAWGLNVKKGGIPLACRSVEVLSGGSEGAEDIEAGSYAIRYTVGWQEDEMLAEQVMALGDTTPVALTAVRSGEEPVLVDAAVAFDPRVNSATFTVPVPEGQWMFSSPEDAPLKTPGGQSVIDLRPLTGSAGLLTGAGLDGFVAGDASCGG
ncbi:MAG: hypothetical protein ACC726_03100 [Chloroflexota bacterium]